MGETQNTIIRGAYGAQFERLLEANGDDPRVAIGAAAIDEMKVHGGFVPDVTASDATAPVWHVNTHATAEK